MTRQEILDYMRLRLDVINSNISPSYEDAELYPFLDRAYLMVMDQQFKLGELSLLKNLLAKSTIGNTYITELAETDGYQPNNESQLPVKVDLSNLSDFYTHINSLTKLTRPSDSLLEINTGKWFANELIKTGGAENVLVSPVNRPYFIYPKVRIDYEGSFMIIYPDYYMSFDVSSDIVIINYLELPQKFENIGSDSEPAIHSSLHHNIADKAADLANIPIDSQKAAQEVQVEEQVKKSSS